MFVALIAGYLVATLFAFCGITSIYYFISELPQGAGVVVYVNGLVAAAWPLAVGVAVFLLTQIANLLEVQKIMALSQPVAEPQRPVSAKPKAKPPVAMPQGSYFKATPVPTPSPTAADIQSLAASIEKEAEEQGKTPTPAPAQQPIKKHEDNNLKFFRVK